MCGISGIISNGTLSALERNQVNEMNTAISHRGPNDEGLDVFDNCILGHRRLSIIDLSKDGHQPFYSHDGNYAIVFNGEIYNYIELREELKQLGYQFTTKTDTEVLLTAYMHWGHNCLNRFNGMFAFAIYNKQTGDVFLARDRFGVKPLYYFTHDSKLYFASEIKALRKVYPVKTSINKQAIFDYLCFNRTDVFDETFQNEVKRIPKGHYATVGRNTDLKIEQWWNPLSFVKNGNDQSEAEICQKIEELICSAVTLRMRSDVLVGSCLSGGLDSSIIVGILYEKGLAGNDFKTFTAAFPGFKLDETAFIDSFQKKHPFNNHRVYPTAESSFAEFDRFCFMMDEPIPTAAFYSQYKVMELAHQNGVTVLLDGQGGDESFAGYQYFHGFYQTSLLRKFKWPRLAAELVNSIRRKQANEAFQTFVFQNVPNFVRKQLLYSNSSNAVERDFFDTYINSSRIFNEFFEAYDLNTSLARHFQYKLEHLLRSEDRNSMAFAIEARLPYLDYRFVEYTLGVSESLKIKNGENKFLQKKALGKYTISEILNRKDKIGFGTPGEEWLKNDYWRKKTEESYAFVQEQLPGILQKSDLSKGNYTFEPWKINHLAQWIKMVI